MTSVLNDVAEAEAEATEKQSELEERLRVFTDHSDLGIARYMAARHPHCVYVTDPVSEEYWVQWSSETGVYERISTTQLCSLFAPVAGELGALLESVGIGLDDDPEPGADKEELAKAKAKRAPFVQQIVWCKKIKSTAGVRSVIATWATLVEVSRSTREFDRDDACVTFTDRVVDMQAVANAESFGDKMAAYCGRRAHPGHLVTRGLGVPYIHASDEQWSQWESYLASTELDADTIAYLQRLFGYALTGRGTARALVWLFGPKGTGKSTFAAVMRRAFGDYAVKTDSSLWMRSHGGSNGHTDDLMPTIGRRLVWSDEISEGARFNERLVKGVSAGLGAENMVRLSAKGVRGVDVPARYLLCLSSDSEPSASAGDDGLFERVKQVRFSRHVDARIDGFAAKLVDGCRPAILAWLIEGAVLWLRGGLGAEPASVAAARAEYQAEQEWLANDLRELFEITPGLTFYVKTKWGTRKRSKASHGYAVSLDTVREKLADRWRRQGRKQDPTTRTICRELRRLKLDIGTANSRQYVVGLRERSFSPADSK